MSSYPLRRLIVPVVLLIGAAVLRQRLDELAPVHRQLLDWLPYVTLGSAIALSAYFNRARLFTVGLALVAAYAVIQWQLQTSLAGPRALVIYSLVSAALPVTVFLLLLVPERGLRNRHGALVASLVPMEGLAGWWIVSQVPGAAGALIQTWMPVKPFAGFVLSVAAAAGFGVGFLAALGVLWRRDSEEAAAVFAVLIFAFLTLAFFDQAGISAVMFAAAGLSLMVSLVRSSYEMAYRDELTGLLGRRALNDRLQGMGSRYVIAMLDVDHFKTFNDTFGHDVGDDVLKMVARQIDHVGGGGTAYRYGGEEFSVVFAGKDLDECEPHLEEIRQAIARYRLALRETGGRGVSQEEAQVRRGRRKPPRGHNSVSVTISIGVAERDARHGKPEEVIKAADAALYRAKEEGRNCLSR